MNKIYEFPRRSGKTTILLFISAITGRRIITSSNLSKKALIKQAEKLNLLIPEPFSAYDIVFDKKHYGLKDSGYLIDNYEKVSQIFIEETLHAPILLGFMTKEENENE